MSPDNGHQPPFTVILSPINLFSQQVTYTVHGLIFPSVEVHVTWKKELILLETQHLKTELYICLSW